MAGPRGGAVADAGPVNVMITVEAAEPVQIFLGQNLAALDGLLRILKGIGHPVVHAQVEVRHDEYRRLKLFGQIEGILRHGVALFRRTRKKQEVLGVAMSEERGEENVTLRRARGQAGGGTDSLNVPYDSGNLGV